MPQGKGTYGSKMGRPPKKRATTSRTAARGSSESAQKDRAGSSEAAQKERGRRRSPTRKPGRRRP